MRHRDALWGVLLLIGIAGLVWTLASRETTDLVLYCGVDQDQSQVLVDRYEEEAGVEVAFHGEKEAFRSVGLPQRLELEREQPLADVWWSNEIMHMVDLAGRGLIAPLPRGLAEQFPPAWRDPSGRYLLFGARARVLLVNTELLPDPEDRPARVQDLLDPRWFERGLLTTMAEPLTGTTYTHAVSWFTRDADGARAFYGDAAEAARAGRMKLVKSNGQVMRLVSDSANKVAFGLTDTDDAWIAISEAKAPVIVIYPDQGEGQPGTLIIPNTAGLVAGGPNPEAGAAFLRWLAKPETEAALAASRSAQIPVRPEVEVPADGHVKRPGVDFRATVVDWAAVGRQRERWRDQLAALYQRGD